MIRCRKSMRKNSKLSDGFNFSSGLLQESTTHDLRAWVKTNRLFKENKSIQKLNQNIYSPMWTIHYMISILVTGIERISCETFMKLSKINDNLLKTWPSVVLLFITFTHENKIIPVLSQSSLLQKK